MLDSLYFWTLPIVFLAVPITFLSLTFIRAPYGRYYTPEWGLDVPSRTGWLIMEIPSAIVFIVIYFSGPKSFQQIPFLLFMVWQAHYLYRSFLFPRLVVRKRSRMPVVILMSGLIFNTINAFNVSYYLSFLSNYEKGYLFEWNFLLGLGIYLTGMWIHIKSDLILRFLRNKGKNYRVPQGFLFEWVCSPNYLGEMLEWIGFALASWCLPALAFTLFTIANLLPRALSHLKWYRKTFPEFPKNRKAIIPYVL